MGDEARKRQSIVAVAVLDLTSIGQNVKLDQWYEGLLSRLAQRITLIGGMIPPRERIAELRGRKDACGRDLKSTLESIQEIGCQLKDIDTGLVDFPSLYKDEEVYLCWKLGESGIGFWHRVEDGYRGRRPIDKEFRKNHRGDN